MSRTLKIITRRGRTFLPLFFLLLVLLIFVWSGVDNSSNQTTPDNQAHDSSSINHIQTPSSLQNTLPSVASSPHTQMNKENKPRLSSRTSRASPISTSSSRVVISRADQIRQASFERIYNNKVHFYSLN
jgi:cytoskeletal protein RodZ